MNVMILICAIAFSMVAGNPAPTTCQSDYDTISKCLADNGLSLDAMFNLMTRILNITEQDFREICQERPRYGDASLCILREYSRCSYEVPRYLNDTNTQMDILCDNLNIKLDCISDVRNKIGDQQVCQKFPATVSAQSASTDQDNVCEIIRSQGACFVNLVTECDQHTGVIYERLLNISVSQACDNAEAS